MSKLFYPNLTVEFFDQSENFQQCIENEKQFSFVIQLRTHVKIDNGLLSLEHAEKMIEEACRLHDKVVVIESTESIESELESVFKGYYQVILI